MTVRVMRAMVVMQEPVEERVRHVRVEHINLVLVIRHVLLRQLGITQRGLAILVRRRRMLVIMRQLVHVVRRRLVMGVMVVLVRRVRVRIVVMT